ncbi:sigma-70 family RNA polymerase sigma factor [Myxococcus sp. K15C18031901]|uniref:sigma-70 family RNA polymerase sigma factor n=1 Tax=Myxococcus dinghuensis TaxID=2906761 RepID=UPI0020A73CAA|nr:sigma-70 family RNA polymerase sigma factor [Myxococcus dinghuensis]MCP3102523.1 sigma-70 family RNA polymerase sigma factor [Myxococcus dinghuensis]
MTGHEHRVRVFVESLSPAARSLADAVEMESLLDSWLAAGRAAWPEVALSDEDFLRHVAERLASGVDLATLPAADLYLACACARGLASAHAALERDVLPRVAPAVARIRGGGVDTAEVLQHLRQRLLVPDAEEGALPRIAEYQGAGTLVAWLRAAAVRTALNLQRSEGRRARVEEDAEVGVLTGGGLDVELDYLRRRHREDFRAVLADALAALSSRERTVLRLHVVEGLSLERIGAMYQTHKSTVSRWVAHAREALLTGARERLAERLQLSSEELYSLMRAVRSQLDLSLPAMLREPG